MIGDELFHIQVDRPVGWQNIMPFCLLNSTATKIKKIVEVGRSVEGASLYVTQNRHQQSSICCKRVGSNSLRICIFYWKRFTWLKSIIIHVPDTNINLKTILKLSGKTDSDLLFYHESTPLIEIRNSCSLKKKHTFNLETICNGLNLTQYYQELKISLDPVYISAISKLFLCLGSIIVLSDRRDTSQVIYKSENQNKRESFLRTYYNSSMNKAFAQSFTQIVMFDFDDKGVCGSRILQNPLIGHKLSIVQWLPSEGLIIYASRKVNNKDDIYFVDYLGTKLRIRCVLKDKLPGQTCYSVEKNAVIYLNEDFSYQKQARCVWLSNMREGNEFQLEGDHRDGSYEEIEGEFLVAIPECYQKAEKISVNYYGGMLVAIPLPHDVFFFFSS